MAQWSHEPDADATSAKDTAQVPSVHADLRLCWTLMPGSSPSAAFDESQHPRGQPDNPGQFKGKPTPAPPTASPRRRKPVFDLERLDASSSQSLNPERLSLNELMKRDSRFRFSQQDNIMRGLWEILDARHDMTMVPTLWGLSGSGKTSGLKKYVRAFGARMFHINCANLASGEVAGLPYTSEYSVSEDGSVFTLDTGNSDRSVANGGMVVRAAMFMWLVQPIEWARTDPDRLALVFLDELNRAPRSVLNEMMTLISEREINGESLPENLRMVAACNPGIDTAVNEFSAAQKARLVRLPFGAVPVDSGYRSLAGFPTLEPTEYIDENRDGSEKTEADVDELYHRLCDIRHEFLKRNPVYLNDLGPQADDYDSYGIPLDSDEAAKSQLEGEGSYGTQRGWHEAIRLMAARLLHMPRWTLDREEHSIEDRTPGTYDKQLVELVLGGYVGEKAAHDFMGELDLLDLPSADEWLNDPYGNVIETLPSADRVAVMAKTMSRGLVNTFEARLNGRRPSSDHLDKMADNLRSWIVFIDRHSGSEDGGSSNRPFVLSSFTNAVQRLHERHTRPMTAVLERVIDPRNERARDWMAEYESVVDETLGYLADRDKARAGADADEDLFAVR